ncbi:ras-related protein Rab-38-like isoform X2 [Stigmatopora nigra]
MRRQLLLKVLVIGDLGVGKTSIIKRYVHRVFSQGYRATVGVDFALKVLQVDQATAVRLQLWDIAGQERYGNMTRVYYKEAVGALVVFDMTRLATFQAVLKWKGDLDSKVTLSDGRPVPAVLLANKCDQRRLGLCAKLPKLDNFCRDHGFVDCFETSAKDDANIDAAISCLVRNILAYQTGKEEEEEESLSVPAAAAAAEDDSTLLRLDRRAGEGRPPKCSGCSGQTTVAVRRL